VMNNSLTKMEYAERFDFIDSRETVKLLNPLSNELGVMRQTLLFGGLENVVRNVNNKQQNLRLFEFGKTYHMDPDTQKGDDVVLRYREREEMVMLVTGRECEDSWNHKAKELDLFYLKNMVENVLLKVNFPIQDLRLTLDEPARMFADHLSYCYGDETIVTMGLVSLQVLKYFDLKKPVYYAEFNLSAVERVFATQNVNYKPIATYPSVKRDLALVVAKNVTYDELERIGRKYGSKLVKSISLFDVYEGDKIEEGKKSYALNFVLQHPDKTLTDDEINKVMSKLIAAYEREVNAKLR